MSEPPGAVCETAIPDTVKISAALISPVAVMLLALVVMFDVFVEMLEVFVEMLLVFVEMLLVLVATSPEPSMISAALIAPVAVMLVALVEMLLVFVEMVVVQRFVEQRALQLK